MFHSFKKNILILVLIVNSIIKFSSSKQLTVKCEELSSFTLSDDELKTVFERNFEEINNLNKSTEICLDSLLKNGFFNTASFYLEKLSTLKVKFREPLRLIVNSIDNKLKEVYNQYRFTEEEFQKVSPVIQWAQNLNNIFIQVKFSHRHDSPGCPEVKDLRIDLSKNSLFLSSYCIQADIPIKFELNLPFFVDIAPEESKHFHDSNGKYVFNLIKAQPGMYWDRLLSEKVEYPKNTRLWMDMHEKYKSEIEKFINDDEEEEYQQILVDIEKKKKKGKSRKKKTKFNN